MSRILLDILHYSEREPCRCRFATATAVRERVMFIHPRVGLPSPCPLTTPIARRKKRPASFAAAAGLAGSPTLDANLPVPTQDSQHSSAGKSCDRADQRGTVEEE
jgi:hypothetical protein